MQKKPSTFLLLILLLSVTQGCNKQALEKAYALGLNDDPDDLDGRATALGHPKRITHTCSKIIVLNRYCLGGNIEDQLAIKKPFRQKHLDGKNILDFREKHGYVTITTFQGKILAISKINRPATWQIFEQTRKQLESQHGGGENHSFFPESAKTKKSREVAIYNKKAQAHFDWQELGWQIDLIWNNMRTINITFQDKDLNTAYLASRKLTK